MAFEKTILNLYERRLLTPDLLDRVAKQYRTKSIDSAGSRHVQTWDGKDLHQICIELVDPSFPICERGSSGDHAEYWERELKKWEEIVHKHWGWRAYCKALPAQSQTDSTP